MSSAASWANTAIATLWPLLGRDDRTGAQTFGMPVSFPCDYSAKAERITNSRGVELTTRQTVYTEFSEAKEGDRLLIGESLEANPIEAGALDVVATMRYSDTFDRVADDFVIYT